jgi:ankyrin repeat protein
VDDNGNTLLHVACQNGNEKIARLLVLKGGNPNHQNKAGNTPGHYAVAYHFYDLATWLFDTEGGAADDTLQNKFGFSPYDGLSVDDDDMIGGDSSNDGSTRGSTPMLTDK